MLSAQITAWIAASSMRVIYENEAYIQLIDLFNIFATQVHIVT